jgi:DNA-directed RNA polymerase specialized sigma24 family protein
MTEKDAATLRRELLALMRRLAKGPLTLEAGLRATAAVRRGLDELQAELVITARGEGASWASIGEALGVTTQAAHQRFSSRV